MTLAPLIEGTVPIRSTPDQFVKGFRERVTAGLLSGKPHPRSNYQVTDANSTRLRVRAADWWTALNVGLNEMEFQFPRQGVLQYRVRYWRWAGYVIGLSGVLGVVGLILLLTLDVRGYIDRQGVGWFRGLSTDQNLALAWAMVLFWGFVWPWLLIAFHKGPVRRLVVRLVSEVDARATTG
jgi:hypothetical protein